MTNTWQNQCPRPVGNSHPQAERAQIMVTAETSIQRGQHWASNANWNLQCRVSFLHKSESLFFPGTATACTEWGELDIEGLHQVGRT